MASLSHNFYYLPSAFSISGFFRGWDAGGHGQIGFMKPANGKSPRELFVHTFTLFVVHWLTVIIPAAVHLLPCGLVGLEIWRYRIRFPARAEFRARFPTRLILGDFIPEKSTSRFNPSIMQLAS